MIVHLFILSSWSSIHANKHGRSIHILIMIEKQGSWNYSIERNNIYMKMFLMYMTTTNVIHYWKKMANNGLSVSCWYLKDHYELLSVRISTYDKLKKDDSFFFFFLVSSRGVQSILGIIFIGLAILFLILHSFSQKIFAKKSNNK